MKRRIILIVFAGLFIFPAFSQNPTLDKNWEVVFQDGFNSPNINTNIWNVRDHFDHYGNSIVLFNNQNVYISNGTLVIATKEESYCCPPQHIGEWGCKRQWLTGNCYKYTSVYIESQELY